MLTVIALGILLILAAFVMAAMVPATAAPVEIHVLNRYRRLAH